MPLKNQPTRGALKVVGKYALFATLWILFSDWAVSLVIRDPQGIARAHMLKGGVFVLVTALLLLVLISRFGIQMAAQQARQDGMARDLKERESLFTSAFELIPVAVAVTRLEDGAFLTVNEAFLQLFGQTREALEGRNAFEAELGLEPKTWAGILSQLRRGLPVLGMEAQCRKADGTPLVVAYSGQIVVMEGLPSLLSAVVDLTGRRQAEEELRHAQKLESLGSLASGVAHDMNNVLAAIQIVAEVMQDGQTRDAETLSGLEVIGKATARGRNLVQSLTNFARKDLNAPEPVDLNQVVREEADLLDRTLLKKVKVAIQLEPGLPALMGERGPLGNALMNLCVNAVDAMPRGGTLTIRTRRLGAEQLELTVEDTGEGMPLQVQARALEPFFTTKPQGKGTGLGLAMVHGIVKAHRGVLQITSNVGVGTVIRATFPALPPAPAPEPMEAAPVEVGSWAGASPGGLRILVVDDDELIRASLPAMLEVLGHTPFTAEGGRPALAMLEQGLGLDLVILDMNMPELSGAETLDLLRVLRPQLPVIVATGYLDPESLETVGRHGRLLTLTKPFSMDELQNRVREMFDRR